MSYKNLSILFFIVLSLLAGCGDDSVIPPQTDHFEPMGVMIKNQGDTLVYYFDTSFLPGKNILTAYSGDTTNTLNVIFLDENKNIIQPNAELTLGFVIGNPLLANILISEWTFRVHGIAEGETVAELQVLHEGHPDYKTKHIRLRIL